MTEEGELPTIEEIMEDLQRQVKHRASDLEVALQKLREGAKHHLSRDNSYYEAALAALARMESHLYMVRSQLAVYREALAEADKQGPS